MEPSILQVLLMFLLIAEISGGEVSSFHYYNPTFANCHTNRMHSCVNGECTYIGFKPFYGELYPVYKCMCPDGWLGDRCDFEDMCPQHGYWLCLNGATCSRNQCHCAASFYGRRCEHRLDHCAEHACQAYSTCVNEPTGYRCECPANRIGTYCEHFHPCYGSNNKCQNDATCVSDTKTGEYQCICKAGFEGDHCEVNLDKCATYSLCIMGTCVNEPRGSFTCHCQPGYIGRRCDQELRPCQPWPCQNGGYCFNRLLTYECRCPPGFGGTNCEIDQRTTSAVEQDNCRWSSNGVTPCQNGARCVNHDGGFECICTRGFVGRLCEDSVAVIEEEPSGSSLDNALTDGSSVESTLSSTTESPTTEKESSFAEAELTTSTFASNFTNLIFCLLRSNNEVERDTA